MVLWAYWKGIRNGLRTDRRRSRRTERLSGGSRMVGGCGVMDDIITVYGVAWVENGVHEARIHRDAAVVRDLQEDNEYVKNIPSWTYSFEGYEIDYFVKGE